LFNTDTALSHRRKHFFSLNRSAGHLVHCQPVQPGHGKEGCFSHTVFQLFQSCLNVSAKFDDFQIRTIIQKLRFAPQG